MCVVLVRRTETAVSELDYSVCPPDPLFRSFGRSSDRLDPDAATDGEEERSETHMQQQQQAERREKGGRSEVK